MFMVGAALTSGHYKTDIISGLGHPKSNSVVPLVLYTVMCNCWGIGIILQVSWDSADPVEKR